MRVSIIVPVYNAEKYLSACIESVINQTNSNWELILVDDGSSDKSLDICKSYAEEHKTKIKVYHKKNEGQYLTRMFGIELCTGEYIGFLDADDFLDKEYVNTIIKYIEETQAEVICFGFQIWDNEIKKIISVLEKKQYELFSSLKERQFVYEQIVSGKLTGSVCSKVFKTSSIKAAYINDSIVKEKRYAEDAFQSFSIMADVENILYINSKLYFYRNNETGASKGVNKRGLDYYNTKYVFELIRENLLTWKMDKYIYLKQLYARNFNETIYHLLKFYRSADSRRRKQEIIQYDWSSYLLDGYDTYIENNEYIRKSYIRVWKAFSEHKHMEIYFREKFRKLIGW